MRTITLFINVLDPYFTDANKVHTTMLKCNWFHTITIDYAETYFTCDDTVS